MPKGLFEKMGFKTVKSMGPPVYLMMMKKHQEEPNVIDSAQRFREIW